MEQQIYAQLQVEPIMKNVKRIIRESSRDGMKLSRDGEMFIVNNFLMYHPEKENMTDQGNYIMVAKHQISIAAGACRLRLQMDQVQISPLEEVPREFHQDSLPRCCGLILQNNSNDEPCHVNLP
ncbi:unnamed protein product [Urochloa humidicola]